MKLPAWTFVVVLGFVAGLGCQRSDQDASRERAERFKNKAEAAAKQLGRDAKELGAKVNEEARQVKATRASGTEASPEEKLRGGAADLKREGEAAGAKL